MNSTENLIAELVQEGVLKTPEIKNAFEKVDRKDFVLKELTGVAYQNTALPIGWGQTISQPYTVAFMLELLQPKQGGYIVDIGYGSCWQAALLAEIVGEKGKIYAIELVKEVCEFGKNNLRKYPILARRVEFYCQNAVLGLPSVAKTLKGFNCIIAAAEVQKVPQAWREQLRVGGRLVYPKADSIFKEVKTGDDSFEKAEYHGFVFVPFVA